MEGSKRSKEQKQKILEDTKVFISHDEFSQKLNSYEKLRGFLHHCKIYKAMHFYHQTLLVLFVFFKV